MTLDNLVIVIVLLLDVLLILLIDVVVAIGRSVRSTTASVLQIPTPPPPIIPNIGK